MNSWNEFTAIITLGKVAEKVTLRDGEMVIRLTDVHVMKSHLEIF